MNHDEFVRRMNADYDPVDDGDSPEERQRSDEAQAWIDATAYTRMSAPAGYTLLIVVRGVVINHYEVRIDEQAPGGEQRSSPFWVHSHKGKRYTPAELISQGWTKTEIRYNTLTTEIQPRIMYNVATKKLDDYRWFDTFGEAYRYACSVNDAVKILCYSNKSYRLIWARYSLAGA